MTAQQLFDRALSKIGIKKSGVAVEEDQYTDAIVEYNNFINILDLEGVCFGLNEISAKEDTLIAPRGVVSALVSLLAIRLSEEYGVNPSNALLFEAQSARDVLDKFLVLNDDSVVNYPDILPVGGNTHSEREFFTDPSTHYVEGDTGDLLLTDEHLIIEDTE